VQSAVLLFLVTFLLILPKGGLKLAGIPITWGYLGLGLTLLWLPLALLGGRSLPLRTVRLACLALLVPFQVISWAALLANGMGGVGFTISFLTTFFVVPVVMVLVLGIHLDQLDLSLLLRAVRIGVLLVAAYGIFLFFYRLSTGSFIEIPYLTVNVGDVGQLEGKHIDRGGIFKLISTYNNGNIYGISMLILLPLYTYLEPRVSRQMIVKSSLILTLSRTVWAGLLAYEVLHRLYVRRLSWRTVGVLLSWLALAAIGVWYALSLLGRGVAFLLDRRFGGRIDQLAFLTDASILPSEEFETIVEMVYLSVLHNFGVVGLTFFLVAMTGPLILHLGRFLPYAESPFKKSLALGLIVYLIVALSDGAILYIPVMALYWFVASLLLSDNPIFSGSGDVAAGNVIDERAVYANR
jgi:hypothetical protein